MLKIELQSNVDVVPPESPYLTVAVQVESGPSYQQTAMLVLARRGCNEALKYNFGFVLVCSVLINCDCKGLLTDLSLCQQSDY